MKNLLCIFVIISLATSVDAQSNQIVNDIDIDREEVGLETNQHKKDSLKADRKQAWKERYRKNSIRIDGFGKALIVGVSYDRILFHTKNLDFHINGGVGFLGFAPEFRSFNASWYLELKKFKIHPILGLGYHYSYNSWPDGEYRANSANGGLVGGQFKLSKNWNMQFHVLPFFLTHENGRHELEWLGNGRHAVTTKYFKVYGGFNIGYQF
jgi:hypothetical protein